MLMGNSRRLVVVAVLVAVSCDAFAGALPGDNYRDLYYVNRTDVPVYAYERAPGGTSPPHPVDPGGTFHNQMIVPSVRDLSKITTPRRFEAKTVADGEIIYCRTFTYAELDRLDWSLVIDRTLTCPRGP
jgi:hypothetical protein